MESPGRDLLRAIKKEILEDPDLSCLIWTGRTEKGHSSPILQFSGQTHDVRNVLWRAHYGERVSQEDGLVVTCGNALCVEPTHARVERAMRDCIECGLEFHTWDRRRNQLCPNCRRALK